MISVETDEIIKELFNPFLSNYQELLENKTKGIFLSFDCVDRLDYLCKKRSLKRGGSHIDFPD